MRQSTSVSSSPRSRFWRIALRCIGAGLWMTALGTQALPPQAGSVMSNQASADYLNPTLGRIETVLSNTVRAVISPVQGVVLETDQTVNVQPGGPVNFTHVLRNTGNTPVTVTLAVANRAGDDFDLNTLRIIVDRNGNGIEDGGDLVLAPGEPLTLPYGGSAALIVSGSAPAALSPNTRAEIDFNVLLGGAVVGSVLDRALPRSGSGLRLLKSVDKPTPAAGSTVVYTLTLQNIGDAPTQPVGIVVDGSPASTLLVRDDIPANTQFASVVSSPSAAVFYHRFGEPLNSYRSTPPALAEIDAIAFGYPPLTPGGSVSASFAVTLGPEAGGSIPNIATTYLAGSGEPDEIRSNNAAVTLPVKPAQIGYFQNGQFLTGQQVTRAGLPLFVQASAGACNADPSRIETYPVNLVTERSGDIENNFTIRETAPNSGIFILTEIPTLPVPPATVQAEDGTIEAMRNDAVVVTLVCGGQTLRSRILIDPSGIVFDSVTNLPVAGATVRIVFAGTTNSPPVLDFTGQPAPSTVITGADGFFQFPLVPPGSYQLLITPPGDYRFPSVVPLPNFAPNRTIINASFGGSFQITPVAGPVMFDVPLDPPQVVQGLRLEKRASVEFVQAGEAVRYTLRVSNSSGVILPGVSVRDRLPDRSSYQPGSTRLAGQPAADPAGSPGPLLNFALPTLSAGQSVEISYVVRLGAGAADGPAVNTAQAVVGNLVSNVARARVDVDRGVFRDEGFILGKVFVDCNLNRTQDPEELGIPGVRVVLDDGTYAISDAEGKYSFYGVRPRTHVLKVDRFTLPEGAEMRTTANRNGGDPHSLFIDLKNGELHRADFAEGSCAAPLVDAVKARRKKGEVFAAEFNEQLDQNLLFGGVADGLRIDPKTRPASGVLRSNGTIATYQPVLVNPPESKQPTTLGEATTRQAPSVNLEAQLPQLADNRLGFMDLRDGDTLAARDVSVRLKARLGVVPRLIVNGEAVPASRIGQRARMPSRDIEAWEYIAVRLQSGANRLRAEAMDGFGNVRENTEITLVAPGDLARIQITLPTGAVDADGQTPAKVAVSIVDERGTRVSARTPVTLEASLGRWLTPDLDDRSPGVQSFVENGESVFALVPPETPGEARLRVTSGVIKNEALLMFTPQLRPLIVAGLLEGTISATRLKRDALAPVSAADGFEEELRGIDRDGQTQGGVRGSMYLKGKVKGAMLLTLAYDSEKGARDELFRDIDPDAFYPIYGDSAVKGFDAQSTSPLYVRLDKGRNFVMYGDFNTGAGYFNQADGSAAQGAGGFGTTQRRLGVTQRSLTGLRAHGETGMFSADVFGSYDRTRQQVREFRGEGVSGPYPLGARDLIPNSERVELITRDRNQPSVVLATQTLTRFSDYLINELEGSITFSRPVSSVDADFNPVFVRMQFEVEREGDRAWVYGAEGRFKPLDWVELGASVVRDEDPTDPNELYGASVLLRTGKDGFLIAEAAQSDSDSRGQGDAQRIEWVQRGERLDARVFGERSSEDFGNPTSGLAGGRREAGFKVLVRLSDTLRLGSTGLYTDDSQTSRSARKGVLGYAEWAASRQLTLEAGLRRAIGEELNLVNGTTPNAPVDTTSARVKAIYTPSFLTSTSVFAEYEQDINDADLKLLAIGGDHRVGTRGRVYARHELLSSLNGIYTLTPDTQSGGNLGSSQNQNTVVGADFDYMDSGSVFSEYRVRDALSGREGEAAVGLRNQWRWNNLKLSTRLERVQPMSDSARQSAAAAIGLEWVVNPLTKLGGRLEVRESDTERSFFNTLAIARKLSLDWSVLGKSALVLSHRRDTGDDQLRHRLRLGFAYRDTDTNRWMWLGRFESRYDRNDAEFDERWAQVFSTHVNWHPSRPWVLSGRLASKHVTQKLGDFETDSTAHQVSGRVIYDVTDEIDLGLAAGVLVDGGFDSQQYTLGAEAGYMAAANLWLSGGYNLVGYHDKDLNEADYTRQGPYARLRFKFDEDFFEWLE